MSGIPVEHNPAEVAADLRAARRRVRELEQALAEATNRAGRLDAQLAEKTLEAARLLDERDAAVSAAAAADVLREQVELTAPRVSAASEEGMDLAFILSPTLRSLLPGLATKYLPGLVPTVHVSLKASLLKYKAVPDLPSALGRRAQTLRAVGALVRERRVPLLFIVETPGSRQIALTELLAVEAMAETGATPAAGGAP